MDPSLLQQIIGHGCVILAAIVFFAVLLPAIWGFAALYLSDNRWLVPVLFALIPIWLLLMVALFCVTGSGGFDWLRLGRPVLYALNVIASFSLGVVMFVFIACYIRPGFIPRVIFAPGFYLIPLAVALLVIVSLNQKHLPTTPVLLLRWAVTIFAALSIILCVAFFGRRLLSSGFSDLRMFVARVLAARERAPEQLEKIPTLDPQSEFDDLMKQTRSTETRKVRTAALARLRSNPQFMDLLAAKLESSDASIGLEFLHDTDLTPDEQQRLALPARTALERFISDIPAPGVMTREREQEMLKWGRIAFPRIIAKFAGTDVDFSNVMPAFERAHHRDARRGDAVPAVD